MLWLYPMYDQDPVGIPFMVDVTPCENYASLGISSQPPWLYLDKSPNTDNTVQQNINPQWLNLFSNNYASNCPIIRVEMLASNGATLVTDRLALVNPTVPTSSRIDIKTDQTFTMAIRIKAFTMSKNNYLSLNVRVCGAETITLSSSAARNYIEGIVLGDPNSMSDSTRYILIPQSTFATWF